MRQTERYMREHCPGSLACLSLGTTGTTGTTAAAVGEGVPPPWLIAGSEPRGVRASPAGGAAEGEPRAAKGHAARGCAGRRRAGVSVARAPLRGWVPARDKRGSREGQRAAARRAEIHREGVYAEVCGEGTYAEAHGEVG